MKETVEYLPVLLQTPLFAGFSEKQATALLSQLSPSVESYESGAVLLAAGGAAADIGVMLAGEIEALKYTRAGGQFTVSRMGAGGVFGDVLAGSSKKSPVTVVALCPCRVLRLPYSRLFAPAPHTPELFRRLLQNLVGVISDKYFTLDARIDLLLLHSLRQKLAAYLLEAGGTACGAPFTIPYTRIQLASYLGCERSALSREVSRMARDGLIEAERKTFCIPDAARLKALF